MAVLWQGTCQDQQHLSKFRCITADRKVNRTTVQALRSNRNQFNKWQTGLIHVSTLKESSLGNSYNIFETHEFFMFFVTLH